MRQSRANAIALAGLERSSRPQRGLLIDPKEAPAEHEPAADTLTGPPMLR